MKPFEDGASQGGDRAPHGEDRTPHGEHFAPEDLLELALSAANEQPHLSGALAEARACPRCSRALAEALAEVALVRETVVDAVAIDARGAADVARAALSATTREDLTWRGDWRVVGRFVRDRLRSSRALRLAAASLVLHLMAVPLIALMLVQRAKDEQRFALTIEPSTVRELPEVPLPIEPTRELVREPEPDSPGPLSYAVELPARPDRLSRARRELLATGAPPAGPGPQVWSQGDTASAAGRLLSARSRRLALGSLDDGLRAPTGRASPAIRALWAELLLDDWALSGRPDPRLAAALDQLSAEPAGGASERVTAAERDLARLALERASSYGAVLPGEALADDPRPALRRTWFAALEGVAADWTAADPTGTVAAWIAWGREHAR